ncbi:Helix-turn-helix [Dyella jiangningensis]|nr:helix-turn-helix protein [Dyella sp. AtDHG13]SDJ27257.1 Helix-turn-helix [Dyella jiangningensis]
MGKIERGEHMPTLAIFLRIAEALGCTATNLMADTEINLSEIKKNKKPPA